MNDTYSSDPLQPHAHEPNPEPPSDDPAFVLTLPGGSCVEVTLAHLQDLTLCTVAGCYIVSTGHGESGPFAFGGVRLLDLVRHYVDGDWSQVEVISADGFGNRIFKDELLRPDPAGPILLAHTVDGRPLTRQEGLVRLIVPAEKDDALRQVKWIGQVRVRA